MGLMGAVWIIYFIIKQRQDITLFVKTNKNRGWIFKKAGPVRAFKADA